MKVFPIPKVGKTLVLCLWVVLFFLGCPKKTTIVEPNLVCHYQAESPSEKAFYLADLKRIKPDYVPPPEGKGL